MFGPFAYRSVRCVFSLFLVLYPPGGALGHAQEGSEVSASLLTVLSSAFVVRAILGGLKSHLPAGLVSFPDGW